MDTPTRKKTQIRIPSSRYILSRYISSSEKHVVPRSTMNTNGGVKFKCYVKPMKNTLGVIPSKGNQETTRGKEKILLTSCKNENPTTSDIEFAP